jgi:fructan beta-fructosidase
MKVSVILIGAILFSTVIFSQEIYKEQYRPQLHFSPAYGWMNDPNGMVYYKNSYHLFYQHYPDKAIWGPMHWGHAISKDLVHWENLPVALYPDSLGYIFSGSAVIDKNNTSGFGKDGKVPMVAIFAQHDPIGEKKGSDTFQTQSIAYSLDNGKTWAKYKNNPVLRNPGIKDFRDPKVMWYEEEHKWIMALATKDCITFYSSKNLKEWKKESDFGKALGAHGGVWECPDLFCLRDNLGKKVWILLVSINPGGPNGGSATQYFTGNFDGHSFKPLGRLKEKWLDYGRDNYAGVTWSNTGNRTILLGWMNNWQYAEKVPTQEWRGAATIPRELSIQKIKGDFYLASAPVKELQSLASNNKVFEDISINTSATDLTKTCGVTYRPGILHIVAANTENFTLKFSNDDKEYILVGYDQQHNQYFIDRTHSGKIDFEKSFAGKVVAPRISDKKGIDITLVMDEASIELFADKGLSVLTNVFFPGKGFNKTEMQSEHLLRLQKMEYTPYKSIW